MKDLEDLKNKYQENRGKRAEVYLLLDSVKSEFNRYYDIYKPQMDDLSNRMALLDKEGSELEMEINNFVEFNIKEISRTDTTIIYEWDAKLLETHSYNGEGGQYISREAFDRILDYIIALPENIKVGNIRLQGKPVMIYRSAY